MPGAPGFFSAECIPNHLVTLGHGDHRAWAGVAHGDVGSGWFSHLPSAVLGRQGLHREDVSLDAWPLSLTHEPPRGCGMTYSSHPRVGLSKAVEHGESFAHLWAGTQSF